MYLLDVLTWCWSRVGACPPSAPGSLQFSWSSHSGSARMAFFFFFSMQRFRLATCRHHLLFLFVCLFICLFSPWPFSSFRSLGWKIDVAGCFFIIIWPGVLLQQCLSQGGSFTIKEKTSHLLWRKAYIWCLFPPPSQAESSSVQGREAKPCWRERRCRAVLFGLGEPCPSVSLLLLCSLVYIFFSTWGIKKKKKVLP